MEYLEKLLGDIFSMGFDFVIPVSGNLIALAVAVTLFSMRYGSFRSKIRKYGSKSRYGKLTPHHRRSLVPAVDDASYCDSDIAIFLRKAIVNRVSHEDGVVDKATDFKFGKTFLGQIDGNLQHEARTPVPDPVKVTAASVTETSGSSTSEAKIV